MKQTLIPMVIVTLLGGAALGETAQPYAGQQHRAIASLSEKDITDLLSGSGWGFAKAAELNGFPGPAHVLELADELRLDPDQRAQVEDIFARMNAKARALGADYVAAEAALDAAFEDATITPDQLTGLTAQAGRIRSELRAVHLAAHLELTPVLNRHQKHTYQKLRGYDGSATHGTHGSGHEPQGDDQ